MRIIIIKTIVKSIFALCLIALGSYLLKIWFDIELEKSFILFFIYGTALNISSSTMR